MLAKNNATPEVRQHFEGQELKFHMYKNFSTTPNQSQNIFTTLRDGLQGVKGGDSAFTAKCPNHDDQRNSLRVKQEPGGKVSITCFAGCDGGEILSHFGLGLRDLYPAEPEAPKAKAKVKEKAQIVCTYNYTDADGKLAFQVVRYNPKGFRQRRPDPKKPGGWKWDLDGIDRPLYRLPEVLRAKADGRPVFLVEGEKDADALAELGLTATTNAGGASRWTDADADVLQGCDVIIIPDNDSPGMRAAWRRFDSIWGATLLILPGLPDKGDVSDWLATGGDLEELMALVESARNNPPERPGEAIVLEPSTASCVIDHFDPFSDAAMAFRLSLRTRGDYRHATDRGHLFYDGTRFCVSEKEARRHAMAVGQDTRNEGHATTDDPDKIKAYYRAARRAESSSGIEATLKIAATLPEIDADQIQFDNDPFVLNCLNGTIDLKTGELRPHSREDYLTKLCPHNYRPDAKCDRFKLFLEEIFEGDHELIRWFKWLVGYTFTGSTNRHIMPILHGDGRNGKSVLCNTLSHVLGRDYAVSINPEDLMIRQNAGTNHSLPRLRGARFALAQETAEGRRIDEALIKTLTGGDPVTTRELYGRLFEFDPTHTLWMSTNYEPRITGTASGIWDRIRLVPFLRRFEAHERDLNLEDKLTAEAEGILAWAVEGAIMAEPATPERVKAATEAYREKSDVLGAFIEEYLIEWEPGTVLKSDVYRCYQAAQNNHCESFKDFNARLEKRGFVSKKTKNGACWIGVNLRAKFAPVTLGDAKN